MTQREYNAAGHLTQWSTKQTQCIQNY